MSELSLFHPPAYLRPPEGQPFGKDVANIGLFSALARYGGYERINVLRQLPVSAADLAPQFFPEGGPQRTLATGSLANTALPRRSGMLLRGAASLSELAWLRRTAAADREYSLVGVIHTTAPPFVRQQIAAASTAPTYPWDALICTSPSVQEAMQAMFDQQAAWLVERFGAKTTPQPQLPLIPLGVDVERQAALAADSKARATLRQQLGLADEDVLVLWVGRLSYFEKAFPQSMLQAVQQASRTSSKRLVLALAGWFPHGEADQSLYQQAATTLAPDVQVSLLNGSDPQLVAQAWAAADVFLSLVDNVQETFGLAPVEAMAAALPVVVSDWDGYRYTVRDRVDGFRIPTLISPAGEPGELLAHYHSLELATYQAYAGAVAQHTAVHIAKAAAALVQLAESADLRRQMGAAGQQRARELFDWPVVVGHYNDLFADLADRRSQAALKGEPSFQTRMQPGRGDPFADFRGFATTALEPTLRLRCSAGVVASDLQPLLEVQLNQLYGDLRASAAETDRLLQRLEAATERGVSVQELLSEAEAPRRAYLANTLVWLAKLGLVDWLER